MSSRSSADIIQRIELIHKTDQLGYQTFNLMQGLPFEEAVPFLPVRQRNPAQWVHVTNPVKSALEYLPVAWGRANSAQMLNAPRSIEHYKAWLWLAGLDDFNSVADKEYAFFGKPVLFIITNILGAEPMDFDDNVWTNSKDDNGISEKEIEQRRLELREKYHKKWPPLS